jgi:uncharacterized protein YhaN
MRIDRLDLIRFGKFTDRSIDFPVAARDFHVVVGPNEAGKSTLRAAILDLLYGIPRLTSHGFVHPMSDLRLGGQIAHADRTLEFIRVKGNRQTLRDAHDAPLADTALDAFLGTTDRDFFAQMFGLNHERLKKGGDSILSASDDVGQVLFQSAAGIGNLGAVRETLEAEADKLWSKRKSGERAYYIAEAELERAKAALKDATVRTRDWSAAQARLQALEAEHGQARSDHLAVRGRRTLLERVRRITPPLRALAESGAELARHADVAELPESAAKPLAEAQMARAAADAGIEHAAPLVTAAQTAIAAIRVDQRLREQAAEIEELNENRLALRAHPATIARLRGEVDGLWATAARCAAQLGWQSAQEADVRARMPGPLVQAELERLMRRHPALQQQLATAERAAKAKLAELDHARAALAALPAGAVPVALKAALGQAQRLGDFEAVRRELHEQVGHRTAAAARAFDALGAWRCDEAALRAMSAPATEAVSAFLAEQLADDAEARVALGRAQQLAEQIAQSELEIAQFRASKQPVSRDQVQQARSERDARWQAFKADPAQVAPHSAQFERLVAGADTLADARHDKIQLESDLQAKQQNLQRMELDHERAQLQLRRLADAALARAEKWDGVARACGLPALPYQSAAAWLDARALALGAAEALAETRCAEANHAARCELVRVELALELARAGELASTAALAVLVLDAEAIVSAATEAGGQRRTLGKQIGDAEIALASLAEAQASAGREFDDWHVRWAAALAQAMLGAPAAPALLEAILATLRQIDLSLTAIDKIRLEQLDVCQAELDNQAAAARRLAAQLAPDLPGLSPDESALELFARLRGADAAQRELERERGVLETARLRLAQLGTARAQADASLAPLYARSGVSDDDELARAIDRSDALRALRAQCASAEQAIGDGGDGLGLEQLRAEAAAIDMGTLMGELEDLTGQDERLVNRLSELAVRRESAKRDLERIGGTADAARAEGQRQEALAKMAETVERYLKVHVGARLLKWSIDQYREIKQGPMLQRAGKIFSSLTHGSFERLTVDFESVPPRLQGRRAGGAAVDIDGLSEGTRDQLYLALRLAALDMHLSQAHVLPFIADDLFINFDDRRCEAGLQALADLSTKTQVIFLTHNDHILPMLGALFGKDVNIVRL